MFGESHSENIGFGPSMVAIPVEGVATVTSVSSLPETPISPSTNFNDFVENSALLLSFTSASRLTLVDGTDFETLDGSDRWVGFQGNPTFTPVAATIFAIPTPDGTTVEFEPAAGEAAAKGISTDHLANALGVLTAAEGSANVDQLEEAEEAIADLSPVLNGAFLGVSSLNGTGAMDILNGVTLVRFNDLSAQRNGGPLAWEGSGPR